MARMFPPSINNEDSSSFGEKRVFNLLRSFLPDDHYVFYNQPLQAKTIRHPDFIVVGPRTGIIILEVKDWELASIITMDNERVQLRTMGAGHKNPLKQAHDYLTTDLLPLLQGHPKLLQTDGKYRGRPKFNYGYGAVLTSISRAEWEKAEYHRAIPISHCIFKSDLDQISKGDNQLLLDKVYAMIPAEHRFTNLEMEDIQLLAKVIGGVHMGHEIPKQDTPLTTLSPTEKGPAMPVETPLPPQTKIQPTQSGNLLITIALVTMALVGLKWAFTSKSPTPGELRPAPQVIVIQSPAPQQSSHAQTSREAPPTTPILAPKPALPNPTIKGNITASGEKIYHVPGTPYYPDTKAEQMFRTEDEAIRSGFRKAKPVIKGNINYSGKKIYHMPGQKYYEDTKAEKWFYTEEEAIGEGFRKSRI